MTRLLSIFAILFLLSNCNNAPTPSEKVTETTVQTPPPPPPKPTYPGLPLEKAQYLWDHCDYIDYVFFHLPISMSLYQQNSIRYSIQHIASDPPIIKSECQPIGRIFYQEKGENIAEADIYFQEGCAYFIFMENNKKTYANNMTEQGIIYLNENIARTMGGQNSQ